MGGAGGLSKRKLILRLAADPYAYMSLRARVHSKTCFLLRRLSHKMAVTHSASPHFYRCMDTHRSRQAAQARPKRFLETPGLVHQRCDACHHISHQEPNTTSPTSPYTRKQCSATHTKDLPLQHSVDEETQLPSHAAAMSTPCALHQ